MRPDGQDGVQYRRSCGRHVADRDVFFATWCCLAPVKLAEGVQVAALRQARSTPAHLLAAQRDSRCRLARTDRLRRLLDRRASSTPAPSGRSVPAQHDRSDHRPCEAAEHDGGLRRAGQRHVSPSATSPAPTPSARSSRAARKPPSPDADVIVLGSAAARRGPAAVFWMTPRDRGLPYACGSAPSAEPDNPLCDLVVDLRAATPTDAAKKVAPDTAASSG